MIELLYDPEEAPTDPPELAFVRTDDGYYILVKSVGGLIYAKEDEVGDLTSAEVMAANPAANTVDLKAADGAIHVVDYAYAAGDETEGADPYEDFETGAAGVKRVYYGKNGSNGRAGALFVPPTSGGDGGTGDIVNLTNNTTISAGTQIGIEAGSVGGNGGKGGNSYLSFWSAKPGGDGGAGGTVNVVNTAGTQVSTTGANAHGIFAYSRSGRGGAGGSGWAAPGGGRGGAARSGGSVTVNNQGTITTTGQGAHGIYGLSVGGAAGSGGSNWGIVGSGGSGAIGGNGGAVTLTNNGTIRTYGLAAHGMLAQSIGGTGGNGGAAGGIVAFGGGAGTGGQGGNVAITTQQHSDIATKGDNSVGILGQSIGGGGGDSGAAGGIVALGASGGSGNIAGTVTITNQAGSEIKTEGMGAYGVLAQSIGGGGGNSRATGGAVSLGGSGASGGNGNTVTVTSAAKITTGLDPNAPGYTATSGAYAHGIFAQSIGGGGGSAGGGGGLVTLGGSGGGGGAGGIVQVTNSGSILTKGVDARGIFAQSIGGGGGAGGATGGLVALGGAGSSGGGANQVTVTNLVAGVIETRRDGGDAIFAQSVGGGGGAGASSGGLVSLGGKGSSGGIGGVVNVTNAGALQTGGNWARGIFAQSVGGGGGSGGDSGGLVAIGGGSSTGSNAQAVTVTNSGTILTAGSHAAGVYAQSVGGGGGSGGSSGGAITIGGSGSGGGLGGAVTVANSGSIKTGGDTSSGIFAQSVGGGGGDGGTAYGVVTIGGSAGTGANGGTVIATHGGTIATGGDDSFGIFAQSVGGGGGNGGAGYSGGLFAGFSLGGDGGAGGRGGDVTVDLQPFLLEGEEVASRIATDKDRSTGIFAQSVGGGGGNGGTAIQGTVGAGVSLSVAIGGKGASGGEGGTVNLTGQGDVSTLGHHAGGVMLQSVGGGGGNGGTTVSSSASLGDGLALGVALGGAGGLGGKGGTVTADVTSHIETSGQFATGFLAQSVGGGGGNGGTTVAATGAVGAVGAAAISVGIGGDAGGGGIGDHVDVQLRGSVLTREAQSDGIVLQSVGGGGGNGGVTVAAGAAGGGVGAGNVTVGIGGSGGDGGQAGRVDAIIASDVETEGDGSDGVVVQSVGGGGGNSGLTVSAGLSGGGVGAGGVNVGVGGSGGLGGDGDLVFANYSGILLTRGDNATGLLAQSVGGGGGNSGGTIAASLNGAGVGAGSVAVGIGGDGGGAGNGGRADTATAVTLETEGLVWTRGQHSAAVVAQSVGGGGGNGGYSIAASLTGAGVGAGAVSVGVGGGAGSGGDGKGVMATVHSDIVTEGSDSTGALIQSVGGGGGNGGFNISGSLSGAGVGSGGIAVGLGGNGGNGGLGGDVQATSTGMISTLSDRSTAFIAQSIGGGGGNGGFNIAGSLSGAGTGSGAISVGLGGNGGAGNDAGNVVAATTGKISTVGKQSTGVLAQSVGGGGGNGGYNIAAGGSAAGTGSGSVSVGLGGNGAGGGKGKNVNLTVSETVTTEGDQSGAVIAQSIGGGGGNGGFNVSAAASGAGTGSGTVGVGLGGSGAGGGEGGAVVLETSGDILTLGAASTGILAQSVGGGGGSGGFNVTVSGSGAGTGSGAVSVGLGGSGEGGGKAGTVNLTVANQVTTTQKDSAAIVAQSIGGGGGSGGFDVTVAGSGAGTGSGAVSVGLGGSAGTGGAGEAVTAMVTGDILTGGDASTGLLAQSVGGGGGNGGFTVSAAISGAGTGSAGAAVGLGGSGGDGGAGGTVNSTLTGDVRTAGRNATAVIAQSVGGGGGSGGMSVAGTISAAKSGSAAAAVSVGGSGGGGGDGETVDNIVTGEIVTLGTGSGGVLAQSVGGGGGNGGLSVSGTVSLAGTGTGAVGVGIGGSGGDGGHAAKVTNAVAGAVYTSGADAAGIVAQSLGGGGGNGGINVTGTIAAAKSGAGAVGVGIGGSGGGGGNAGEVDNTFTGYVQTLLNNSTGILAQSVGGGGGNGGLNVTGTVTAAKTGSGGLAVGVGGFGGDGGTGADVSSSVTGGAVTTGRNAAAMVAQSVGGGGGNGGLNVAAAVNLSKENGGTLGVGIGGFGGGGGNAGNVTSTVATTAEYDRIATTGDDSAAVVAQSIGGGGGNGGLNVTGAVNATGKNGAAIGVGVGGFGGGAGDAGTVDLDVTGTILTSGNNSHGLVAQSVGGGGGSGGTNIAGSLAIGKPAAGDEGSTVAAAIGVGGFGGGGGQGEAVTVNFDGTIVAQPRGLIPEAEDDDTGETIPAHYVFKEGTGSHGILAQSLGGGGGNGGVNVSGGISYAAKESDGHALLVGVGGFGGTGGNAGTVDVTVTGGQSIAAYGTGHSAILAQSNGGGGGNGGLNVSGGIVSDSPLIVGVGGFGGNGGTGGDVTVTAASDVYAGGAGTEELSSAGIFAQSLGGGGGNGGLNVSGGISLSKEKNVPSITVGVGGFGGTGAVSGNVDVDHQGSALTTGNWVHGILAQSLAGGGGNGALNISGELNWADSANSGGKTDLSIVAGIGGHGGLGADAGAVTIASTGAIATAGDYARGIFAQSIGGGGGNGGMNVTGVFAKNSSPVSVGIGGFGSGGGDAGAVSVTRGSEAAAAGLIRTDGIGAIGLEASSIGGGGGDAGMNFIVGISLAGSSGGSDPPPAREHPKHTGVDESVFVNFDKVLDELEGKAPADKEDATDAGKESAFAAQIAIGGAGGEAGHGAAVTVDHRGDILTLQKNSHGILGQSIGGGGGNASLNLAVTYEGKSDKNKGFNLAIGGAPGDGGNGATVDVSHDGVIETAGDNSYGVLAQSIGGGGGNVGLDVAYSKTDGGKVGITLGRQGGTGGVGGKVTLSSKGSVVTGGKGSFGLLAQSIGNGGGNSSSTSVSLALPADGDTPARAASVSVGLEGGIGGAGGDVTLDAEGWVGTSGENAHAIFAQSVGGGGGNGGSASGFAVKSATAALSLGGTGGQGGVGGTVKVTSSADVRTSNSDSVGILAQSVGGGGGTGGAVRSGGLQSKGSGALVAVGGGGGDGMAGGAVTVDNSGVIITDGKNSHGVLAQSLGGGGGNAGMVINSIYNSDAASATQLSVSVGGSGGDGATSGAVAVTNSGGIGTSKEHSIGILAQSVGGGGGNANTVITGSVSGAGAGNKISLGIGGAGGTGGAAGDVTVSNLKTTDENSGKIITLGNYSHGILAMSVGGGGGTGRTTITSNRASGAPQQASSYSVAFSLGGAGGDGGTGGAVSVVNSGEIATYGYKAHGILAQSVGGGGGSGGLSIAGDLSKGATSTQDTTHKTSTIAVGGFGGNGNTSGDVTVTNSGNIEVFGNKSYGIYAQSVGGGGGDGGFSSTLSRNLLTNPKTNLQASLLNIGMGGNGGDGADSGDVLVNHNGSITIHGDDAYGIFAQSVGGGGGSVGSSITAPAWMAADYTISTLLGGRDGSKGTAGTVTLHTTGDIHMLGANSRAQFAQSVNGGGGNVDLFLDVSRQAVELGEDGFELPNNDGIVEKAVAFVTKYIELGTTAIEDAAGSFIDATHVGDLYTWGANSYASLTQSIGGGGGNANTDIVADSEANIDLVLALGGAESARNAGGDLTLARDGRVATQGDQSPGVGVQSIGGGGGNLTVNLRRVPATEDPAPALLTLAERQVRAVPLAAPGGSGSAAISLGSNLGDANDGGAVSLPYVGDLTTAGDLSPGLIIQSIGGGGGMASLTGLDRLDVGLGASGASSGDGGQITVSNEGAIVTAGTLSHGVLIQSIGGGGGAVFTDLDESAIALTRNDGGIGNGGAIDFAQVGDIVTGGARAYGLLVQSLGGGGGTVDALFAGGAGGSGQGGAISLILNDRVISTGADATAIFVQSLGGSGAVNGSISLLLGGETVLGGSGNGVGVHIDGGAANLLVNHGALLTLGGIDGRALLGGEGGEVVDNHGLIMGTVDLGGGANRFDNHAGAMLQSGTLLTLGTGNTLTNAGLVAPGGSETVQTTALSGNFVQSEQGTLALDIDLAHIVADRMEVSGAAQLAGQLVANPLNRAYAKPGRYDHVAVAAQDGVDAAGLNLLAPPTTAVVRYGLVQPNANEIAVQSAVDFSPGALGHNSRRLGSYINTIQNAGGSESFAPIALALMDLPDAQSLDQAYSGLMPEVQANLGLDTVSSSLLFNDTLHSCRQREGDYRFAKEGDCVWARVEGGSRDQDRYSRNPGYQTETVTISTGLQRELQTDSHLGFALSYQDIDLDSSRAGSEGSRLAGGVIVKHQIDAVMLSTSLGLGYGNYDSERRVDLPTPGVKATSEQDVYFAALHGRIGYDFMLTENHYIRPLVDLGFTHVNRRGFTETGAGAANLDVSAERQLFATIQPAVEIGGETELAGGLLIRPFLRVGMTHYMSSNKHEITARMQGAPAGVDPFTISIEDERTYADLVLGVDLIKKDGINLRFNYAGQFSGQSASHVGGVKLAIPF